MSLIGLPLGGVADGGDTISLSVASPLDLLRNNPTTPRVFALVAEPYDPGTPGVVSRYVSSWEYTTAATDTPASWPFESRLIRPLNVQHQLFSGATISGEAVPAFGNIEIANGDGLFDDWYDFHWFGRDLRLYVGLPTYQFKDFALVMKGTSDGLGANLSTVEIRYRDLRRKLQRPVQTNVYAGTGGLEGGDALKGKTKPKFWGQVRQLEPVPVDPASLIYQLNDGAMQAVDAVRDQGAALAFNADVADITTATPTGGQYATSLATGYIKLGASPAGTVTVDARGDKAGALGYRNTLAGIIRKMATESSALSDPGDLETGSFADLDVSHPEVVGWATGLQSVSVEECLNGLIGPSRGLFWAFTRAGKLQLGEIPNPSAATASNTFDNAAPSDLREPQQGGTFDSLPIGPIKRVEVAYKKYWRVLSAEEAVSAATEAARADFGEEYRVEAVDVSGATTEDPEAVVLRVNTTIDTAAAAATEATRLATLFGSTRRAYSVGLTKGVFGYNLADVIELKLSSPARLGLASGKNFIVVGYLENIAVNQADEITLTLWG